MKPILFLSMGFLTAILANSSTALAKQIQIPVSALGGRPIVKEEFQKSLHRLFADTSNCVLEKNENCLNADDEARILSEISEIQTSLQQKIASAQEGLSGEITDGGTEREFSFPSLVQIPE